MASTFLERLKSGEILIADGATGTNFQIAGLKPGQPPEDWVIEEPDKVLHLHRSFVEAGSDIILTDTFGGTRMRMTDSAYADDPQGVNQKAAGLARQAADEGDGVMVGGSMGPIGQLFEPWAPVTHDAAVESYAEQAKALEDGGADFLIIETMFAMEEAKAAIEGAQTGSNLPVVCSFSYDQGVHTMMGLQPKDVVEQLKPLGLAAIGANCGKTLDFMAQIVEMMVEAEPSVPLWAKPNAGLPKPGVIPPEYDVGPDEMASYAVRYVETGAQIVGGCCGTSAAHVKAIAEQVRAAVATT